MIGLRAFRNCQVVHAPELWHHLPAAAVSRHALIRIRASLQSFVARSAIAGNVVLTLKGVGRLWSAGSNLAWTA